MSMEISVDSFWSHIQKLQTNWKNNTHFQDFDALVVLNGKDDQNSVKIKTTAIHIWLFGFDFVDTVFAITKQSFILIGSAKKIKHLSHFQGHEKLKEFNIVFLEKQPADNANADILKQFFEIIQKDSGSQIPKIATLQKERQIGPFITEYEQYFKTQTHSLVELSPLIQESLCVKDNSELQMIQKASKMCVYFENKLIEEIERIIDVEEKKSHSSISQKIDSLIENENEIQKLKNKYGMDKSYMEFSYSPIIQSGGNYDLRPQAESNDQNLKYDVIIASTGCKYREYNSNIVRTLFIDPTDSQKEAYNCALELQKYLLGEIKIGKQFKEIYEAGVQYVTSKFPKFSDRLPNNFGFGTGLEFREANLMINIKNEKLIEDGMVIIVGVSFEKLEVKDGNKPIYSIQIQDTLIVKQGQNNVITTDQISKKYEDISYSLQDAEDDESNEQSKSQYDSGVSDGGKPYRTRRTGSRQVRNEGEKNEKLKKEHQSELRRLKQIELTERLENDGFSSTKKSSKQMELDNQNAYKTESDISKDLIRSQIHVDMKRDCVLLPVNGSLVPFHGSLIKNVQKIEEGKTGQLRLNFHFPSGGSNLANLVFPKLNGQVVFIKELTFRSRNNGFLNDTKRKIQDMQKSIKTKMQERNNREEMIDQDKIVLNKGKKPILRDMKVRPNLSNKKSSGVLECHTNGFKYTSSKSESVEVIFRNIKYAFFQPCENEMIIALHFHLYNPVMIGKKKTQDIQFYTDAGTMAEDINNRRRGQDHDEYEEEERERQNRKKLNREFEQFIKAVEEQVQDLKFDVPYRDLGFQGSPFRSIVLLCPTVNCLINLIDSPFFIMPLEDIEMVCFERMMRSLKNFDLVFVFKDYEKPIQRITAIPSEQADQIKSWLDKMDLIFFESTKSFNWQNILGTIRKDIQGFVEDGGWDIILGEDESEQGVDEDMEGDEEFSVSAEDFDSEEDDLSDDEGEDFDEQADDDDDDDADSFGGGGGGEEESGGGEGTDWSDMSQEFEKQDKNKYGQDITQPPIKGIKGRR